MARATFGGGASDFVMAVGAGGTIRVRSANLTLWTEQTGGTQITDLLLDGDPVTSIAVPSSGQVPQFQGPDGVLEVWASASGGARVVMLATDYASALDDEKMTEVGNDDDSSFRGLLSASIGAFVNGLDVVLLVGQSNMQGADNAKDIAIDLADARMFEFPCSGPNISTIQPATEPLHHVPGASVTVGPGIPFARWWLANRTDPDRGVLLVPAAYSGTGMRSTSAPGVYWRPSFVPGPGETNLYDNAVIQANAAIAAAGPGARLAAILWCQGESDSSTTPATYQSDLLELIDGFRSEITGAEKVPFVLLSMVPAGWAEGGIAGRIAINAIHVDIPYLRERCGYAVGLDVAGVGSGGVHYDTPAQRYNGSVALAAAFDRALGNQIGAAPNAPTGLDVTQDQATPTQANVTWVAAKGRVTDYTVQYRTADGESWTTLTRTRSLVTSAAITGITAGNFLEVRVLTVNENGSSAPSISKKIAMLPVPTIAVVQTASDTVTVTTTSSPIATGYRMDYKLTAASTWTLGTVGVSLTATISGLGASAYDFRVVMFTPLGSAIRGASSYTLSAIPIDTSSITATVHAAWGLRKMLNGYSGNVIRVRRSSDNTEQNIGLSGNDLDVAALLTFAGAGDAFVKTIYDQSGAAKDVTQATTAAQPKIVSAGALLTNNGRPAMDFDGTDDCLVRTSADVYALGGATLCGVASGTSTATSQEVVFGEGNSASNNAQYIPVDKLPSAKFGFVVIDDANTVMAIELTDVADAATFGATTTQWSLKDTGSFLTRYRGGTQLLDVTAGAYSRSGKTLTLNRQTIGAVTRLAGSRFAKIRLGELVILSGASVSNTDRQFVEANQRVYHGTPSGL